MPRPQQDPPASPETRWQGLELLGRGYSRRCVVDPRDPGRCLKFELADPGKRPPGPLRRLRLALARRWPRFGDNARELRAWRWLQRRLGAEAAQARFAPVEGLVDTPWGPALRCRLVRLPDGRPAPNLHAFLAGRSDWQVEDLCAAVEDFAAFLRRERLPLFDLNPGNFVVVPGDGGHPRLVCVDAKSVLASKEVVPLSRHVPSLRERKITRRAARLCRRLREAAPTLAPAATGH